MRSTLDPNVANVPRHAEATDARLAIRQHEEQPKRKKDEEKRDPLTLPEDMYDQASIAVAALIEFLRGFLKTLDQSQRQTGTTASPAQGEQVALSSAATTMTSSPSTNPDAARAALAYQHTAAAQTSGQILQPGAGAAAAQSLLQTTEVRQIHALITKLNTLQNRGVTAIKLEKADSFLAALDAAADHALALS